MVRPALLLVAVCVLTAGCSVLGPDHTREEQAKARLAAANDALNTTETYRFETDMTAVATADGRTERIDVDGTGAVSHAKQVMWMNATHEGETRRAFVLNRTVYQECASPWNGWSVEELDEDEDLASQTPAVRQLALLESGSLYHNGTDTVDGEEAVLLVGEPTADAVKQYQERRSGSVLGGPSIENPEIRVWLEPKTDRLRRTTVRFEVSGDDGSATAELTSRFFRYDDSVTTPNPPSDDETVYELGCPEQ